MTNMNKQTADSTAIVIEQKKRLSESLLWRIEREYFEQKGIDAWLHEVPFYVTNNPIIAHAYIRVVLGFIRDWTAKHPESKNHPFYILELGTGTGRLGYYALKAIAELQKDMQMEDVKIVYVMSDVAKANLDYHQTHHALLPFLESGALDLAVYDMGKTAPIKLLRSNIELNQATLVNPLVLFANYVFDTIANDAFYTAEGNLYELQVNLSTDTSNLKNNRPIDLEKVNIDYQPHPIHDAYYKDAALDGVLDLYKKSLRNSCFLLPISSIRALDHLRKLANGRIFMLSSDKSYTEIAAMENLSYPSLSIHGGCFSMMANCHAIGEYFKLSTGDYFAQSTRRGLKTCIFTSGMTMSELPQTRFEVKQQLEESSPADFFNIYQNMNQVAQFSELGSIASYLQYSKWDPHAYMRIKERVLALINESEPETINFLANNMHKLADNYYFMPNTDCVLFEVGIFFHAIHRYQDALNYYLQAEKFVGEQFGIFYNIALCLHHLERNAEAMAYFSRAYALNPESQETKDWMEYLNKQSADSKQSFKSIDKSNQAALEE